MTKLSPRERCLEVAVDYELSRRRVSRRADVLAPRLRRLADGLSVADLEWVHRELAKQFPDLGLASEAA